MTMTCRAALISALALALAGCNVLAGRPRPVSLYVLQAPMASAAASAARSSAALLLGDTDAPGIYQGLNLVYSRTPGTLSQYQYARWSELPARRFNTLLRQRLDTSGLFQSVADVGAGVRGDLQLNTRLLEFQHDAAQPPGVARVALEAELVDRRGATLVARRLFHAETPAPSHDATGAALALGRASGQALDELVAWLERVRPPDAR